MLDKALSRDELHQLASSFASLPVDPQRWSDFQSLLLSETTESFLKSGDREGLVLVLSVRCPYWFGSIEIERCLALSSKTLKDPITALGDAYSKSTVPETRAAVAAAVRRAFTASGVHGKDDREFVENAMRWYEGNKDRLEVNPQYREKDIGMADRLQTNADPLFVPRAGAGSEPRK